MSKRKCCSVLLIMVLLVSAQPLVAATDGPMVGVFLFSPSDDESCSVLDSGCVPPLEDELKAQAEVRFFDPTQPEDYNVLLGLQQARGMRIRQMPAVFIGDHVLQGEEAIRDELPDLIEVCLAEGGCPFPSEAEPSDKPALPSMAPPPVLLKQIDASTPGVVGYMGTEPACPSCLLAAHGVQALYFYRGTNWRQEEWSWFVVRSLLEERQNLTLRALDVDYADNEQLWADLSAYYGVSEVQATPVVFVGDYALVGDEISPPPLIAAWKEYSEHSVLSPSQLMDEGQPRSRRHPVVTDSRDSAQGAAGTERDSVAHAAFFYSPTCPHCKAIEEEVLPPLQDKYGSTLDITAFNVQEPADYERLVDLESRYDVHIAEVPVIFIADAVLVGEDAIRVGLEHQIESCLQAGGCAPPADRQVGEMSSAVEETPEALAEEQLGIGVTGYRGTGTEGAGQPMVQVAYFFEQGCQVCGRVWYDLRHLLGQYANVYLRAYDIGAPDSKILNEALCERYGVPEGKRLSTPALFVGDQYLLGDDITLQRLDAAYGAYRSQGTAAPWEVVSGGTERARTRIVDRFRSFGLYTVVAAGLIDGLNPCAFATIIFFVSYLAIAGRREREILGVGAAFTLGVFVTYLLVGVGLWKFLQAVGFLTAIGRWVYMATALFCLILAVFSILDYRKARRGELEEMTLSLPHGLRMRINSVIRRGRRARAYAGVAFVTGLVVSIIELACTGQVYLPTIIFVMGVPELRVRALFYLLLYNLMFILPLVVIFVLVFRGTTSKQLTGFLQARAATVKLGMSGLFFALAGWLIYAVFGG